MLLDVNIRLIPMTGYPLASGLKPLIRRTGNPAAAGSATRLRHSTGEAAARREAMFILSGRGVETAAIAFFLGSSTRTVLRRIRLGTESGDYQDRPRSGRPRTYSEDTRLKIVAFHCQIRPLPTCGRWTLRWAAARLTAFPALTGASPSKSTIHRILRENNLKPHLSSYFLHISDPDFFPKMDHLLALFRNPPGNLFFFDECPGIQLLKRLVPDLRTERMARRIEEFEYVRNGTMDVFAFLSQSDGKIHAECHANHAIEIFLGVFRRHVELSPSNEKLHYVMDNLASHRAYPFCELVAELSDVECPPEKELNSQDKRAAWLNSEDKRVVIHFTPYHGSWLNLVEIWFGIMGGKVLGESFGGPEALKAAFEAFVEEWNELLAHPFRWSYDGEGLHEKAVKRFADALRGSAELMETRLLTKTLTLMVNLLEDYFRKVPEQTWRQLIGTVSLKNKILTELVEKEDGPKRKEKAKRALTEFWLAVDRRFGKNLEEMAA